MKITGTQIIILFGVLVVGFFGLVGYQTYLENQPDIIPEEVIEAAVYEIFEQDSVITIPIEVEYQYTASDFISNGDTTYWFFTGEMVKDDGGKQGHSRVLMLPYSHFDFSAASDYLSESRKGETKSVYIESFKQISKASYLSYKPYAKKY